MQEWGAGGRGKELGSWGKVQRISLASKLHTGAGWRERDPHLEGRRASEGGERAESTLAQTRAGSNPGKWQPLPKTSLHRVPESWGAGGRGRWSGEDSQGVQARMVAVWEPGGKTQSGPWPTGGKAKTEVHVSRFRGGWWGQRPSTQARGTQASWGHAGTPHTRASRGVRGSSLPDHNQNSRGQQGECWPPAKPPGQFEPQPLRSGPRCPIHSRHQKGGLGMGARARKELPSFRLARPAVNGPSPRLEAP